MIYGKEYYLNTRNKWKKKRTIFIGVDEAGRGPLFGPVYTGAVVLPENDELFDKSILKDSKKFTSEKKINQVSEYIIQNCEYCSIDSCDHEELINTIFYKQRNEVCTTVYVMLSTK